ncbi:MAG: shikimate dehydrogenase [Acidobacteriota bacterium]
MTGEQPVRICVPVCESDAHDLAKAVARAAEVADIIELRLDCLAETELQSTISKISASLPNRTCALIFTYRPAEQGGHRPLSLPERLSFVARFHESGTRTADYLDIESDLAMRLLEKMDETAARIDWTSVICSHHDFDVVPADLTEIYERMAVTPARILKIAVQASDVTDCLPIFNLLTRARHERRELIAIAMGTAGLATRILGPSRGSFLTYGALEEELATAPGQVTAVAMRDLYRLNTIDRQTKITGLVGFPVAHSVSPVIHNAAFEATGVNAVYMPFPVRDLAAFLRRMVHPITREIDWNIRGLSITTPHKAEVMNYLDWIEPRAREIGAVNTVVVEADSLHGYNTDASAFVLTLRQSFGQLRDARCALIGSGGAAAAALWGLKREGAQVTVFARDRQQGQTLAERFGAEWKPLGSAQFAEFDLVINATTLGMSGSRESKTPATAAQLRGARLAYDLVYNPIETKFLSEARAAGCQELGGLPMLVAQAVDQFELWTGVAAPYEVMMEAARQGLLAERK